MKQDILILSPRIMDLDQIYAAMDQQNISASIVFDIHEAMAALVSHPPAFFWLDIDLEDAGLILQKVSDRVLRPSPYIILTSSFSDSEARADMLNQGVDTCLEVPVGLKEIIAVLNAALRREEQSNGSFSGNLLPCIEHKDLFIDPLRRTVRMRGQTVNLTNKEYELLYLLVSNPGIVMSKNRIYSHIWKTEMDAGASVVTDHISSLRQRLGLRAKDTDYIQTVFGVGYRFAKFE